MGTGHFFDCFFTLKRTAFVRTGFMVGKKEGTTRTGVFCSFGRTVMFGQPFFDVAGNTGIERTVAAAKNINEVRRILMIGDYGRDR